MKLEGQNSYQFTTADMSNLMLKLGVNQIRNYIVYVRLAVTTGSGKKFRAMANGDPTSLELFHHNQMHLFNGKLTVIAQSSETAGKITIEVSGKGVKKAVISVDSCN